MGEIAGYRHSLKNQPFEAKWFYSVYAASVVGSAATVWLVRDLVWLTIAAQVLNAFLLPLVVGFLLALERSPINLSHFNLYHIRRP